MYKLILVTAILSVAFCPPVAFAQSKGASTYSQQLKMEEERRAKEIEAIKQHDEERDNKFGILPDDCSEHVKSDYSLRVEAFRKSIAHVRRQFSEFNMTPLDYEQDVIRIGKWDLALDDANKTSKGWIDEMVKLYQSDPAKYSNIGLTLMEIVRREGQTDRVENILEPARVLIDTPPAPLDPPLIDAIGYVGYANCDYDLANKAWSKYSESAVLPESSNSKFRALDISREQWEREKVQREEDKKADNPIVQLITSKGTLTIELFEQQAPNSVANFIYLIERGHYTRNRCFKVYEKIGIQTGCQIGDGTGDAGYRIPSESHFPDARKVFRGSLFYAIGAPEAGQPLDSSTASSQFVIATTQIPTLSDSVTVFGRVIDGDYKLGTFHKVDLTKKEQKEDPKSRTDFVTKAVVVKKGDHDYIPEILAGQLPR